MEKSHTMAAQKRTIRGRPFPAWLMVTALRIFAKVRARAISPAAHALLRVGTRHLNPLMLSLAGSGLPMVAVIHHRGRRSGRSYTTPLAARSTADGFVIPLTFGERADWFRNVQEAGGCMIRWKGVNYPVIEPVVVDWATVRSAFSPIERVMVPLIGIEQFVRLRHAPASSDLSQRK
jgi:deazaflavin-dependent oxidoreductase (nitroreductase family)